MDIKHIRLSIDFHITIADTPPLLPEGIIQPPDPEYDARQARLLEAVKNNPEVLTQWLNDQIAFAMFAHAAHDWFEMIASGEVSVYDMLAPVLTTLPADDQEWFRECDKAGYFSENVDMFQESFTLTEEPPGIVEIEML